MIVIMMMILLDCDFGFQAIPLTLRLFFFLTNNYRLARVHENMDNQLFFLHEFWL